MSSRSDCIVFLGVNASFSHSSLALRYLAAGVPPERWQPILVECTAQDPPEDVLARIEPHHPRILAVTFYLFNRMYLGSLIAKFKFRAPECIVVGGGPEFLGDNRAALETMPELDVVVRGEGERAFASILDRVDVPESWTRIPGVCLLRHGHYVDNGHAEPVICLDELPLPYETFPLSSRKPFAQIETSRGCSNTCSFCTSAGTAPVRTFSIERTRDALALLRTAGVHQIRLVDRTFNERPRRAVSLLTLFRDEFPEMGFHLEIDPARLTATVMQALREAPPGQLHLEAGIQCLQPAVLSGIRRKGAVDRARRGLADLCALPNLRVHVDLIGGLPGATFDDVLSDLDALTVLAPDEIQLEILKILPGAPLAAEARDLGLDGSSRPPYAIRSTPEMPPSRIRKVERLSVLVDRLYNTECLRPVVVLAVGCVNGFWRNVLNRFRSRKSLRSIQSLEARFVFLDRLFDGENDACRHALHYAWMRKGLSARNGICKTEWVCNGIPPNARLIDGRADLPVARAYRLDAGKAYVFAYASGRGHGQDRVGAVYEVE